MELAVPKPKLILRIGVTGHRPDKFGIPAQEKVAATLRSLFAETASAASALRRREDAFFSNAPPEIRIVSALAEGADRVVAQAGLDAGFALDAILPFPPQIYESDFETAESKAAFRHLLARARARFVLPGIKAAGDPAAVNRSYEAAGLMTLRQCDLVIAVWDGEEASGRGGTEKIVQRALASGRPVLRFDADGSGPFLLQPGEAGGADAGILAARAALGPATGPAAMGRLVIRLCAPPVPAAEMDDRQKQEATKARDQLRRFLAEKERRALYWAFSYPWLLNWFGGKGGFWRSLRQRPYQQAVRSDWRVYLQSLDAGDKAATHPITDLLMPRFAWADSLANRYGQLHRSGYVSNFVMAAAAVAAAAFHVVWVELLLISLIATSTYWGVHACWHARWLDYRQLSTLLRHLRVFAITGSSGPELPMPHISEEVKAGPQWVSWYYRLTAREIGFLEATVDANYVAFARAVIEQGEIADQIAYHRASAPCLKKVGSWLEGMGYAFFLSTLAICAYEVALDWNVFPSPSDGLAEALHAVTGIMPAIGAALFGIKVQGDFEGAAERSMEVARRLEAINQRLLGPDALSFAELSALCEHAAVVMAEEVGDWSFVYRGRPLTLPS